MKECDLNTSEQGRSSFIFHFDSSRVVLAGVMPLLLVVAAAAAVAFFVNNFVAFVISSILWFDILCAHDTTFKIVLEQPFAFYSRAVIRCFISIVHAMKIITRDNQSHFTSCPHFRYLSCLRYENCT